MCRRKNLGLDSGGAGYHVVGYADFFNDGIGPTFLAKRKSQSGFDQGKTSAQLRHSQRGYDRHTGYVLNALSPKQPLPA